LNMEIKYMIKPLYPLKMKGIVKLTSVLLVFLVLPGFFIACSNSGSPNSDPLTTTPPASGSNLTYGQFADSGKTLFSSKCAFCHGDAGQGSSALPIIGAGSALDKYNTAQGLLDKISKTMPGNAPASLSQQEYLQIEAYLLTQNNFVSPSEPFDEAQLNNVLLKQK
jgi:hypothetical protein